MKTCRLNSRICLLVFLICLAVAVVSESYQPLNTTIQVETGQLISSRTKRSIRSWKDKFLAPLRSLMGSRAYDPWRYFMTVKRRDVFGRRSSSSSPSLLSLPIPAEFDARLRWPYCPTIGEIFEQGSCASCWVCSSLRHAEFDTTWTSYFSKAVAPTDVMSDRICIRSGGRHIVRLSAGNLLSCCRMCGKGCKGGFPGGAWIYWSVNLDY